MFEWLFEALPAWGFPAVFALLLLSGLGVPVPEDVPLLVAGGLCRHLGVPWFPVALLCLVFVLVRDSLAWSAGRWLGPRFLAHPRVARTLTPDRIERIEAFFERHGLAAVFAGRFMAGVRSAVFFVAGSQGVRFLPFLAADGLAAALSIPLFVGLGWAFVDQGDNIHQIIKNTQAVVVVAVLAAAALWLYRHRRAADKQAPEGGRETS